MPPRYKKGTNIKSRICAIKRRPSRALKLGSRGKSGQASFQHCPPQRGLRPASERLFVGLAFPFPLFANSLPSPSSATDSWVASSSKPLSRWSLAARCCSGSVFFLGASEHPNAAERKDPFNGNMWMPHEKHGRLTKQSDLPDTVFAFPKQRKEPLTDASHVRNAIARFDQVTAVSDEDRAQPSPISRRPPSIMASI